MRELHCNGDKSRTARATAVPLQGAFPTSSVSLSPKPKTSQESIQDLEGAIRALRLAEDCLRKSVQEIGQGLESHRALGLAFDFGK